MITIGCPTFLETTDFINIEYNQLNSLNYISLSEVKVMDYGSYPNQNNYGYLI